MPAWTGETKPMASSTRSALSTFSVPGIGWNLASTSAMWASVTRPSTPTNFVAVTPKMRSEPSSCDDEVLSFSGQFGQVESLSSFSGGRGMISSWVTERAP